MAGHEIPLMKSKIYYLKSFMNQCRGVLALIALALLACPSTALAQDEARTGTGSVLNILLLGLIAYFLVRMYRRRMGGGDKRDDSRNDQLTPRDGDAPKQGGKVLRPMDRHEAARQMWGHYTSDRQDAAPVESPRASAGGAFNEAEFLEGAKLFFTSFQQASKVSDIDALQDFLSDEVYADAVLAAQREDFPVRTEIMLLNAKLMEVKSEDNTTRAAVFYDGQLRRGEHGERTEIVKAVWEFSRDDSVENGLWKLDKINKVDQ